MFAEWAALHRATAWRDHSSSHQEQPHPDLLIAVIAGESETEYWKRLEKMQNAGEAGPHQRHGEG
jgi:hypothetical protein